MKYTLILASEPNSGPEVGGEGWQDYSSAYIKWNQAAAEAGILSAGEPVHPPSTATTVRSSNGEIKLHDGPFAETKECIIGWYLIECENLDDAIEWASKIPLVERGFGAVDDARRRRAHSSRAALLTIEVELCSSNQSDEVDVIDDDELALIFLCCHPAIATTDQVMLTLRIVAGMPPKDIAAAFFADHEAIRTRLLRAKRKIRSASIPIALPRAELLQERFQQVHAVLYLIFNEGYLASRGESALRADLTREAIRLAEKLLDLAPDNTESHGLLALFLLTDARTPARTDETDALVRLKEQNRDLWRKDQIVSGFNRLRKAMAQQAPGKYALQAAIAAEHAKAATYDQTNWVAIVQLYDRLIQVEDSPVYRLNRCVAVSFAEGPLAALELLSDLGQGSLLADNYQLHATRAALLARIGKLSDAITTYQLAIAKLKNGAIKSSLHHEMDKLKKRRN